GVIDPKGRVVLPFQYAEIGQPGTLIPVRRKAKWGYVDRRGQAVVPERYDLAGEMIDGYARVRAGQLFGGIGSAGVEVIPQGDSALDRLPVGLWGAAGADGVGVVDAAGVERTAFVYEAVQVVLPGLVRVEQDDRMGYIDITTGRLLWREEGFG